MFRRTIAARTRTMPAALIAVSASLYITTPTIVATTGSTEAMIEALPFSSPSRPRVYSRYGKKHVTRPVANAKPRFGALAVMISRYSVPPITVAPIVASNDE